MKQEQTHRYREQTVVAKGEGGGGRMSGRLGLADANYYLQDGRTETSFCIAQRTVFTIL